MSNKAEKRGLVPKLRFPAFRDKGAWCADAVDDLISTITPPKKIQTTDYLSEGQFPIIDQGQSDIAGWTNDSDSIIDASQPLIVFGDHTCALKLVTRPFAQGADGIKIIHGSGLVDTNFLYQSLCFRPVASEEYKRHFSILKTKVVAYPDLKSGEQQKIADCLASLDEQITLEAQKLDTLKTHKKGLMQHLFPAEGETEPRHRFSNEGDWIVASLPEVVFFQEGPGIMAVDFRSEGVPLVRLAGVAGTTVTLDGCNYLDPEKVAQKWAHFRLVLNDLVISTSATFGLSSVVTDAASGAVFYTGLIRFRPSNERLSLGYLQAFLGSPHFARQAESAAVGGGIKHFGPTHLKQMEIPIPPLVEQQKIADCLATLDDLITAQTQKLAALKAHKKGLMQQLFPSLEADEA